MLRRASEKSRSKNQHSMTQYYVVIGFFVATMIAVVLYAIFDPKESVATKLIVDENAIMVHNGGDNAWTKAPNAQFEVSCHSYLIWFAGESSQGCCYDVRHPACRHSLNREVRFRDR